MNKKAKVRKGLCPICNKGPRTIDSVHPQSGENICLTCYRKATGKKPKRKRKQVENLVKVQA